MGYAVDSELVTLSADEAVFAEMEASQWWTHDQPLASLARAVELGGALWRYGNVLAAMWRDLAATLEDEQAALVIGHSGELELALVCCFPDEDHGAWGAPFGPLEGARIGFAGDPPRFIRPQILRVSS
jgi:hypothetical protein